VPVFLQAAMTKTRNASQSNPRGQTDPSGSALWRRFLVFLGVAWIIAGCSEEPASPQSFTAEQQEIIAAASKAVSQYEDWADRAEYKIEKHAVGWRVTAWRVAHPEAKGNARYVPWGYRVILVDRRGKVVEYQNSK
jgi:hypothetical protein